NRETVRPLLERLPERERRILVMRFFRGMTQTQIAEQIGISQMHVSRLLSRSLSQLREHLGEPASANGERCPGPRRGRRAPGSEPAEDGLPQGLQSCTPCSSNHDSGLTLLPFCSTSKCRCGPVD